MPTDFFFNTGIATYIWVITNNKEIHRRGKVQLINAVDTYSKMRKNLGKKRKQLTSEQIDEIVAAYEAFEESDISKIFNNEDFGYITVTVERPLRNASGEIERDRKGNPKPDKTLKDTENIPLTEDVDTYFAREVLPYAPDAWMNRKKDKIGYEIPFTRYFYTYTSLRPSAEILADIHALEASIAEGLAKVLE